MYKANLQIGDFELAMERSFLHYLKQAIPSFTVEGNTVPVNFYPPFPYDQFEDARRSGAVVTVEMSRINSEGWMIGSELPYDRDSPQNTITDVSAPFRYSIQFILQAYTGSSMERGKLDGKLMDAMLSLTKQGAPVYEFSTETSAVTAYDTGSRIYMPGVGNVSRLRNEDVQSHDYMTQWTVDAKCIYIFESTTSLVTAVSAIPIISF